MAKRPTDTAHGQGTEGGGGRFAAEPDLIVSFIESLIGRSGAPFD